MLKERECGKEGDRKQIEQLVEIGQGHGSSVREKRIKDDKKKSSGRLCRSPWKKGRVSAIMLR